MGARLSAALAAGRFELPCCKNCGAVQYPPSEICRQCLSDTIEMSACDPHGTVIASTCIYRSYAADFATIGPSTVASIKMNAGPVVFAHVLEALSYGIQVTLVPLVDGVGDGVLGALVADQDIDTLKARFRNING